MAEKYCGESISLPTGLSGDLDVLEKYKDLMNATLDEESLYMQSKKTFYELFKDLDIDPKEKAKMVSDSITQITTSLSSAAMGSALQWAKEERDGTYTLSILYGQALKAQADVLLAKAAICKTEADTELTCVQKGVTMAGSIRENGAMTAWDPNDLCVPTALANEGLKYAQTKMVEGQRYGILSDSYMKNGEVTINAEGIPVAADGHGKVAEEIIFSKRQRISFEDSKRNHAANAASQMISGLLAAEVVTSDHQDLIDKWSAAMDYLNADSPCPTTPTDCD